MRYFAWFFVLSLLSACASSRLMSGSDFNAVAVGVEISKVEEIYGAPFDVETMPNGTQQYRYLQRIYLNADTSEQIEYIFTVRNGRIIDKQRREERSSYGLIQ